MIKKYLKAWYSYLSIFIQIELSVGIVMGNPWVEDFTVPHIVWLESTRLWKLKIAENDGITH